MATEDTNKSERAKQTMRDRAAKHTAAAAKPKRLQGARKGLRTALTPLRYVGRGLRFISRFIIPPYFRNSWKELRQVTWPNRKQTRQLTIAVIIFAVLFGIIVALTDYGLDKLFKKVILKQ